MNSNEENEMDQFGAIDKIDKKTGKKSSVGRFGGKEYIVRKKTYRAIYRLLDYVSPIDSDCGQLCGAVCCLSEGGDMGIYLLPGEAAVFGDDRDCFEWSTQNAKECGFPESWEESVSFIKCKTPPHCVRHKRPVQCRTFPLMPYLTEDGELQMIYNDNELPYLCPLIEEEIPLNDSFVKATHTAWKHLLRDHRIYDLIWADSEELREALIYNI